MTHSWIVKNEEPEASIERFEDRIARQQEIVGTTSTEQLEAWIADTESLFAEGKHDLVQAARIELRKRKGEMESITGYSGAWLR